MKKNVIKVVFIKDCQYQGKVYFEGRELMVREWFADELVNLKLVRKKVKANTKEMEVKDFETLKALSDIKELKTKEEKFKSRKTK